MSERVDPVITFNNESLTLTEWANRLGISPFTLWMRIEKGWPIAAALTSPSRKQHKRVLCLEDSPPYDCYFKCGELLHNKLDREESSKWLWFTGYADATIHVCARCRNERKDEVKQVHAASFREKP